MQVSHYAVLCIWRKEEREERNYSIERDSTPWHYLAIARIPSKFSNVIDITAWNPSNAFESTKGSIKREEGDRCFLRRGEEIRMLCVCVYVYLQDRQRREMDDEERVDRKKGIKRCFLRRRDPTEISLAVSKERCNKRKRIPRL